MKEDVCIFLWNPESRHFLQNWWSYGQKRFSTSFYHIFLNFGLFFLWGYCWIVCFMTCLCAMVMHSCPLESQVRSVAFVGILLDCLLHDLLVCDGDATMEVSRRRDQTIPFFLRLQFVLFAFRKLSKDQSFVLGSYDKYAGCIAWYRVQSPDRGFQTLCWGWKGGGPTPHRSNIR